MATGGHAHPVDRPAFASPGTSAVEAPGGLIGIAAL